MQAARCAIEARTQEAGRPSALSLVGIDGFLQYVIVVNVKHTPLEGESAGPQDGPYPWAKLLSVHHFEQMTLPSTAFRRARWERRSDQHFVHQTRYRSGILIFESGHPWLDDRG